MHGENIITYSKFYLNNLKNGIVFSPYGIELIFTWF